MYIAPGQGQTTPKGQMLMSTESPYHFAHLLQVSKWSLRNLIFIHIFNDFIYVYSPGARAYNPLGTNNWCQQKALITLPICCKFQNDLFEIWFLYTFLMILYMYIALGQEHTTLWGQTIDVNRKPLSLFSLPIHCKFKKRNLILYTFLMILYMYIALGQGQTTPWGQTFDVSRKPLSLCSFVAGLKK